MAINQYSVFQGRGGALSPPQVANPYPTLCWQRRGPPPGLVIWPPPCQKQRKRLKAGKKALCRTCRPLATAEVKAATEAAELAVFNANASSGAMDGVARTVRGRKRKAQAPSQRMKDESVPLFAELQTTLQDPNPWAKPWYCS